MRYDKIVESLSDYIKNHPESKTKQPYEVYNAWVMTSGVIIKDKAVLQWMIQYIKDLKDVPQEAIKDLA